MVDIGDNLTHKLNTTFWSRLIDSKKEFIDVAYVNSQDPVPIYSQTLRFPKELRHKVSEIAPSDFQQFVFFLGVLKATYFRFFSQPHLVVFSNTFPETRSLGKMVFSKTFISEETTGGEMLTQLANHFNDLFNMNKFDVWEFLTEQQLSKDERLGLHDLNLLMTYRRHEDPNFSVDRFHLAVDFDGPPNQEYLEFRSRLLPMQLDEFVQSYEAMLESFVSDLKMPIVKMNMTTHDQLRRIMDFSSSGWTGAADVSVLERFEENALRSPDATALVCGQTSLSYGELQQRVNQLAQQLSAYKKSQGAWSVGIALSRSNNCIIAMLAAFKAGGCFVPLDAGLPASRIKFMLDDIQPVVVIVENKTLAVIEPNTVTLVNIDEIDWNGLQVDITLPWCSLEQDAYVVYTSGSTGNPKGIRQTNKTLANLIEWQIMHSGIESGLRFLQYTSFSFDASIQEIWFVLGSSGTLHIIEDAIRLNFEAIKEYILEKEIEIFFFPYSVLGNFFNANDSDKLRGNKLKHIISGSEQVFIGEALEQFLRKNPAIKFHNQYGPSETHVVTSYTLNVTNMIARVPIGKPISNTRIYILDDNRKPVPIGMMGEIYISGYNLANGYWKLQTETESNFLELELPGRKERVYRTGDFAKWMADGNIAFLGRGDDQVKIRGFRIELSEISKFLLQQSGIRESVVVVYNDLSGQKKIGAFILTDGKLDLRILEKELIAHFPNYMVPHRIITMNSFPLTPNGKLDKRKLQQEIDTMEDHLTKASAVQPVTLLETDLLELWKSILNNPDIGTDADFFRMGGDSMRVIRLVGKINTQLSLPVEAKDIYNFPTVRALAKKITETPSVINTIKDLAFEQAMVDLKTLVLKEDEGQKVLPALYSDFYPVADIQFGMLFHSLKEAEFSLYHDQNISYVEDASFNFELLCDAIHVMVERHEILRTSFLIDQFSVPIQIVHPTAACTILFRDIADLSTTEKEVYLHDYAEADLKNKFDIHQPGLFRFTVVKVDKTSYGLLLSNHHAILDGWSYASMMTELSQLYFKMKEDRSFRFGILKSNYKEFIKFQWKSSLNEEVLQFWKSYMSGYQRTALPFNAKLRLSLGHVQNGPIRMDDLLQVDVKNYAERHGYSYKEIFLSAFLLMIKLTTNSSDITIGLVSNARPEVEDGDRILGCFLNTIPFRFVHQPEQSSDSLLEAVKNGLKRVKGFDRLALSEISKTCGNVSFDGNPFYDILFDYVDFHIYEDLHESTVVSTMNMNLGNEKPNGILELQVQNHSGIFTPWLIFRSGIFSVDEIARLSHYFIRGLELITSLPASGVIDTDKMLTQQERKAFESLAFDQFGVTYPDKFTIVDAFSKSVEDNPQRVALKFSGKPFTYSQLDSISDKVAIYLQEKFHVKPNELIGIMVDRSELLIFGLLGILKSGATYVPIDVNYPEERKEYILQKSFIKVILTNENHVPLQVNHADHISYLSLENIIAASSSGSKPTSQNVPDDLAYIIFTSGSTGKPKGVKVTHRNVVRLLLNEKLPFAFSNDDRWFCLHSECFDFSVWEIFGALTHGATLVLATHDEIYNIDSLLKALSVEKITVLSQTPTAFANWVSEIVLRPELRLDQVRYIVFGGEALNPNILSTWKQISPSTKLINMYGITETTVHVTFKEVLDPEIENGITTIGRPLPTLGVLILDDQGRMVPMGTMGEIAVIGLGVSMGYVNDNEQTYRKFVTSRYWDKGLCYLSGDIGRLGDNNEIEYVGRKDSQAKIRGYRIELQEIEIALGAHTEIKQAKVLLTDQQGDKSLTAYYVSVSGLDIGKLPQYLKQRLPSYMVPSRFIRVDQFRFNENGKLDVRYLAVNYSDSGRAPVGKLELELFVIWEKLLGTSQISAEDNFFEIGGNSLKAAQLILQIGKSFGKAVTIREAFEYSTIALQAELLKDREEEPALNDIDADEIKSLKL